MKIVKNKFGKVFLELNETDSLILKKNLYGQHIGAEIALGTVEEAFEKLNTPLLEDIFFLAQAELQERDRKLIDQTLGESKHE